LGIELRKYQLHLKQTPTNKEANKKSNSVSNKIKCSHILVAKQSEATDILEKIKKGEKFGAVAKQISTCPSSKKEGDLGYFVKGQMVKEFENVAFKLQVGEISEPVKTEFGYHIIKRLG